MIGSSPFRESGLDKAYSNPVPLISWLHIDPMDDVFVVLPFGYNEPVEYIVIIRGVGHHADNSGPPDKCFADPMPE